MTMTFGVKVSGDEETMKAIDTLAHKDFKALVQAVKKATMLVEREAKIRTPVLTGRLRSSITHAFTGRNTSGSVSFKNRITKSADSVNKVDAVKEPAGYVGKVGTIVKYAPHVEFGTSKQSAQPYLFPALQESMGRIKVILTEAIKKVRK